MRLFYISRLLTGSLLCGLLFCSSCRKEKVLKLFEPQTIPFYLSGRTDVLENGSIALIGPASSVHMNVVGDSASVFLNSSTAYDYVTLVADDINLGRFKIDSTANFSLPVKFEQPKALFHRLSIYKATEANTGIVRFEGISAFSIATLDPGPNRKKIEFIGNSITCGAAMDDSKMPCGTGNYKNYHNAYLSYGPRVSREIGVDFMLSSVSGFGVYRGWNTELGEEVNTVPDVYKNLYLDGAGDKKRDFSTFKPDIVSICLGTNDLSKGDGTKKRLPFDEKEFVTQYIRFIASIYGLYPDTQIVLLNSPMVSGQENDVLIHCLEKIKRHFDTDENILPIKIFKYSKTFQNGCTTHPDVEDHSVMARELAPFFKNLLVQFY